MRKSPVVNLGLQALAFSMKGTAATRAEQHALGAAAVGCSHLRLTPRMEALRLAALACGAAADPLTEDLVAWLRAALDELKAPEADGHGKPRYWWTEEERR